MGFKSASTQWHPDALVLYHLRFTLIITGLRHKTTQSTKSCSWTSQKKKTTMQMLASVASKNSVVWLRFLSLTATQEQRPLSSALKHTLIWIREVIAAYFARLHRYGVWPSAYALSYVGQTIQRNQKVLPPCWESVLRKRMAWGLSVGPLVRDHRRTSLRNASTQK